MPDALVITVAAVAVFAVVCSLTLGVWLTARAAWIERRRKRGGYIDFNPSPPTRRSPRVQRRRRP